MAWLICKINTVCFYTRCFTQKYVAAQTSDFECTFLSVKFANCKASDKIFNIIVVTEQTIINCSVRPSVPHKENRSASFFVNDTDWPC